jgi:hypothetical protein
MEKIRIRDKHPASPKLAERTKNRTSMTKINRNQGKEHPVVEETKTIKRAIRFAMVSLSKIGWILSTT